MSRVEVVLRALLRRLLEGRGYVVHKWPSTRFDGMRHALALLRRRGYAPAVVVDCGANLGQWLRLADAVFPGTIYHAVEPLPDCVATLLTLARSRDRLVVHATAAAEPGRASVRMIGSGNGTGSGSFVALPGEGGDDAMTLPATTLDALLASEVPPDSRALLKLDVERYELSVLRGAERLLTHIEVVVVETSVFDADQTGRPVFTDLMAYMTSRGFVFYDIASLQGRQRDGRLRQMDVIFVHQNSPLIVDAAWQ